jgi:DNA-binding transcriptional regulator YiaG
MTGNQLKKKRENTELSQEKLAQYLDVAVSTVARWEQLKDKEIPNSKMVEIALGMIEDKANNNRMRG